MRLRYNAPVTLTFAVAAALVLVLEYFLGTAFKTTYFVLNPQFDPHLPLSYVRLMAWTVGHADWQHLIANFSLILLIGPLIEEKYGSVLMLLMMMVTAAATGLIHIFLFPRTELIGASGIAFMLILLSSLTSFRSGEIPVTFLVIMVLYVGKEFLSMGSLDNISHFGHILGGTCGAILGFLFAKEREMPSATT